MASWGTATRMVKQAVSPGRACLLQCAREYNLQGCMHERATPLLSLCLLFFLSSWGALPTVLL